MDDVLSRARQACLEPPPHPDPESMRHEMQRVADWVLDDFKNLPDRAVGRNASRSEMEALLREPAPEQGIAFAEAFEKFRDCVAPNTLRPQHPRFWAFIPGSPSFTSILGDWLTSGANYFAGVWLEAAGPAQVELVVLDWFKSFLGFPEEAAGTLTSGGSEANLTALVAARESLPASDHARAVLYLSEHRHWSVDRAAKIMGLRPDQLHPLTADRHYRLDPERLQKTIDRDRQEGRAPWAVIANAGATNAGTVDPLAALSQVCRENRVWLHVDAAYGWSAVLTEEGRRELAGIEKADSITLDPHKWFAQTFDAGCVLVRRGQLLEQTFAMRPDYLQDALPQHEEVNFADRGLALTRRFRALKIWLSIQVHGVAWHRQLVAHCFRLADYFQALIERTEQFEIVSPRQLSIVCFRWKASDVDNVRLAEALRETGQAFLSTTRLDGHVALRACFVNWRTTAEDVEQVVSLLCRLAE